MSSSSIESIIIPSILETFHLRCVVSLDAWWDSKTQTQKKNHHPFGPFHGVVLDLRALFFAFLEGISFCHSRGQPQPGLSPVVLHSLFLIRPVRLGLLLVGPLQSLGPSALVDLACHLVCITKT